MFQLHSPSASDLSSAGEADPSSTQTLTSNQFYQLSPKQRSSHPILNKRKLRLCSSFFDSDGLENGSGGEIPKSDSIDEHLGLDPTLDPSSLSTNSLWGSLHAGFHTDDDPTPIWDITNGVNGLACSTPITKGGFFPDFFPNVACVPSPLRHIQCSELPVKLHQVFSTLQPPYCS